MDKITYNIYLDESSIDNPKNHFMVIGGIFMKRSLRNALKKRVSEIRKKYDFYPELKWTKLNKRNADFSKEMIDLFFEYPKEELQFHCIVVDKREVDYASFHEGDKELAFFKFIYTLLKYKFKNFSSYYLFIDNKDTADKKRISKLGEVLDGSIYFTNVGTKIQHIQQYCSKDIQFIQMTDLLMGAVGYEYNTLGTTGVKNEIKEYIAQKLQRKNLNFASYPSEEKFNIFKIKWN